MRQITEQVVGAFVRGRVMAIGNTYASDNVLSLHGNIIAKYGENAEGGGDLWITTAGWDTATTRERLNGLPGVSVYRRNRQLFFNGLQWDGSWIRVADRPQPQTP